MGQLGTSVADEDFIGSLNPAGWNLLKMTRVEFGMAYNGMSLTENIQKKFYASSRITGFTMAIPVSPAYGIGMALGMIPVTNVNYQVTSHSADPNALSEITILTIREAGDYQKYLSVPLIGFLLISASEQLLIIISEI